MRSDHRAKSLVCQNLQQQGVRHPTVNDVHGIYAAFGGVQRTGYFGQHAAGDGAVGKQLVNAPCRQVGEQVTSFVENPWRIRQQHQLLGLEHGCQFAGHHVGVDVVAFVVLTKTNRADNRNESVVLQGFELIRSS